MNGNKFQLVHGPSRNVGSEHTKWKCGSREPWPVKETEKNVPHPRPLEIRKALEVWEKWQPTGFR